VAKRCGASKQHNITDPFCASDVCKPMSQGEFLLKRLPAGQIAREEVQWAVCVLTSLLRSIFAANQMRLTVSRNSFAFQPFRHCSHPKSSRSVRAAVRAAAGVNPPPADYDFRADCRGSLDYVKANHPSLVDLVEEGQQSSCSCACTLVHCMQTHPDGSCCMCVDSLTGCKGIPLM